MRKGSSRRRSRRPSACAPPASGASVCCSSSARSGAATAPPRPIRCPTRCRFLINGEPTDSRLATATRGVLRVRLTRGGRAAHSSVPEQGESAIEKLLDALLELRAPAAARRSRSRRDVLHRRPDRRRRRAERDSRRTRPQRSCSASSDPADDVLRGAPPAGTARGDFGGPPRSAHPYAHRLRVRDACLPVHDGRAAARPLGHAAAFGPGSILVAHTDEEFVTLDELHAAVGGFERLARGCLAD